MRKFQNSISSAKGTGREREKFVFLCLLVIAIQDSAEEDQSLGYHRFQRGDFLLSAFA